MDQNRIWSNISAKYEEQFFQLVLENREDWKLFPGPFMILIK